MRGIALAAIVLLGCGEPEVGTTRIALRASQALDPSQVASVEVAAIAELATCVTGPGSNQCATIKTVDEAAKASGFARRLALTPGGGSTATFDELPFGRVCFVAEALSANLTSLASGCAEVTLRLEKHKVEIELQSP